MSIDTPTLLKLRSRMVKHASIKRHPQPEDIASEYVVRLLSGLHAKATIGQAYIDIVRGEANGRSKYFLQQLNFQRAHPESEKILTFIEDSGSDLTLDEKIDLKNWVGRIKNPRVKFIFEKRLLGHSFLEIAEELGVTESYVQQLLSGELEEKPARTKRRGRPRKDSTSGP